MKRICVITATRAEYGLLKPLMQVLKEKSEIFQLQLLVTGAHLSPEFGYTYKQIEEDGFAIDEKVEMLLSADSASSIVKSMGLCMISFADVLERLKPDAVVILGDRYEMLAIASCATIMRIPIIHINGGDITEGAYDDAIRHAITKLSTLHFPSTEEYRNRVIQMGEQPEFVFNVGAIGLDNIRNTKLMTKSEIAHNLGIIFKKYNYQVTFHPETLSNISAKDQFQLLLNAIKKTKDSFYIFTKANADTSGRDINKMIDLFVSENSDIAVCFNTLGSYRYLSVLNVCNAIIGNSSSGIVEAPALGVTTINIGERQKGRLQANTIINVNVDEEEIYNAILMTQKEYLKIPLEGIKNPYGDGKTTEKIINKLISIDFSKLKTKSFYNIQF